MAVLPIPVRVGVPVGDVMQACVGVIAAIIDISKLEILLSLPVFVPVSAPPASLPPLAPAVPRTTSSTSQMDSATAAVPRPLTLTTPCILWEELLLLIQATLQSIRHFASLVTISAWSAQTQRCVLAVTLLAATNLTSSTTPA